MVSDVGSSLDALDGLAGLVREAVADLEANGEPEPVPAPRELKTNRPQPTYAAPAPLGLGEERADMLAPGRIVQP